MFLQGTSVALVTGVSHTGGKLVVQTTPASVPDFASVGLDRGGRSCQLRCGTRSPDRGERARDHGRRRPSRHQQPLGQSHDRPEARQLGRARPTAATSTAFSTRRSWTGEPSASASPSTTATTRTASAARSTRRATWTFDAHMAMYVKATSSTAAASRRNPSMGTSTSTWSLARRGRKPRRRSKIPVLTPPISWNVPFIAGGFPFFLKIEFQIKVTIALTAKNSTLRAGSTSTTKGSGRWSLRERRADSAG